MNLPRQLEGLFSGKRIASNLILIDDAYPHKGIKMSARKIDQGQRLDSIVLFITIIFPGMTIFLENIRISAAMQSKFFQAINSIVILNASPSNSFFK